MNLAELFAAQREQFPALDRCHNQQPAVFLDGPAGTQVPQRVIDAMSEYLVRCNANHCGAFATSIESDRWLDEAHQVIAEFLGAVAPESISFGQNMTSLTFSLSRALARTWQPGDEIIVTRLDHDANIRPWMLAAQDAGVTVRVVEIHPDDCTLQLDQFHSYLSEKTRLVAVGCASNSVGTINPVTELCHAAREVGAFSFVDAVHYAPHRRIDVEALGCDFLVCSAYKFFGPHIGIQWGRNELLEELQPYKLRPAPDDLPGKWMTGTQSHESIAGAMAAVEYLAQVGQDAAERQSQTVETTSQKLDAAFAAIESYESELTLQLLDGLKQIEKYHVWGISDPERISERMPTLSITHQHVNAEEIAKRLGEQGIFVWHGHYYAIELSEVLGREPEGMVRIGMVHYNTPKEIDRLLDALAEV